MNNPTKSDVGTPTSHPTKSAPHHRDLVGTPGSALTTSELVSQLQEAFAGYLGLEPDEVDPDQPIDELGLDSLNAAQLALDIEERLGVSVFLNDLSGQETIADLAAAVLREGGP